MMTPLFVVQAGRMNLQTLQQFGFLAGKFIFTDHAFLLEVGKAFDERKNITALVCVERELRGGGLKRLLHRLRLRGYAVNRHDGQLIHRQRAVLAAESQRSTATLLLRNAADLMIQRVIDRDLPADVDG